MFPPWRRKSSSRSGISVGASAGVSSTTNTRSNSRSGVHSIKIGSLPGRWRVATKVRARRVAQSSRRHPIGPSCSAPSIRTRWFGVTGLGSWDRTVSQGCRQLPIIRTSIGSPGRAAASSSRGCSCRSLGSDDRRASSDDFETPTESARADASGAGRQDAQHGGWRTGCRPGDGVLLQPKSCEVAPSTGCGPIRRSRRSVSPLGRATSSIAHANVMSLPENE